MTSPQPPTPRLPERCASPRHWVIGGYSVNRSLGRWLIRLDPGTFISAATLPDAREIIRTHLLEGSPS